MQQWLCVCRTVRQYQTLTSENVMWIFGLGLWHSQFRTSLLIAAAVASTHGQILTNVSLIKQQWPGSHFTFHKLSALCSFLCTGFNKVSNTQRHNLMLSSIGAIPRFIILRFIYRWNKLPDFSTPAAKNRSWFGYVLVASQIELKRVKLQRDVA